MVSPKKRNKLHSVPNCFCQQQRFPLKHARNWLGSVTHEGCQRWRRLLHFPSRWTDRLWWPMPLDPSLDISSISALIPPPLFQSVDCTQWDSPSPHFVLGVFLGSNLCQHPHFQARRFVISKQISSSFPIRTTCNGLKIARIAPISTIFAQNSSRWHGL